MNYTDGLLLGVLGVSFWFFGAVLTFVIIITVKNTFDMDLRLMYTELILRWPQLLYEIAKSFLD